MRGGHDFFTCGLACLLYMMTGMTVPILFDQQLIRQHRQRAASNYADFAFLKDAAAARLADRLELMRRDFDLCLDVGAHDGRLAQHFAGLGKIGHMIHTDPAETFAIAENSMDRLWCMRLASCPINQKVLMRYFPVCHCIGLMICPG